MQKLEVFGANKLRGQVKISGSKNASLPILAATLLSNKKINLSNGGTISHYKNSGNWKDSLGNYGTQKCYGTILIDPSKKIEDWKMFCEGMDQDRNYFVLEYFRNSDMTAGTGSYIFIDGTGKWKNFIGTKCKYAINYLDNAIFNFDKCKN